jgi:hypothetical protein
MLTGHFSQGCRDACCRQASLFLLARGQRHAAPARLHAAPEVDVRRAPAPARSCVPGPGVGRGAHHPPVLIARRQKNVQQRSISRPPARLYCRAGLVADDRPQASLASAGGRGRRPELSPTGMRRCGGCRHEYLSYDQSDRLLRAQHRLGIGQHCKVRASSALQGQAQGADRLAHCAKCKLKGLCR